jgi:hypothetical protein
MTGRHAMGSEDYGLVANTWVCKTRRRNATQIIAAQGY